ncbi:unnamed protein product [Chrysoparadoxa australica]
MQGVFGKVLWMAFPGMIVNVVLTATCFHEIMPYEWDWPTCFLIGGILAATDPVAVVALLEELGVAERLGVLIEGESLFNDGSAIVVFELFLAETLGFHRTPSEMTGFAARLAFGGPALGIFAGIVGSYVLGMIYNDALAEITVTVVLAWGVFVLAGYTRLMVSAVLGIVTLGLILGQYGKPRVSPCAREKLTSFWNVLDYMGNSAIFFIAGVIIFATAGQQQQRTVNTEDWGYLFLLYVLLYAIRWLVVLLSYPVLRTGEALTLPEMCIVVHAGLRGAVSLILALIVDSEQLLPDETRDKILFFTSGIAVLTIVVQGMTCGPLVKYFKLDRSTKASEAVLRQSNYALELQMENEVAKIKDDPWLLDADWNMAWRYIPVFTSEVFWRRICSGNLQLGPEEVAFMHELEMNKDPGIKQGNFKANKKSFGESLGNVFSSLGDALKEDLNDWFDMKLAGFNYTNIPVRVREMWHCNIKAFPIEEGGADVRGRTLDEVLSDSTIIGGRPMQNWESDLASANLHGFSQHKPKPKALKPMASVPDGEEETKTSDLDKVSPSSLRDPVTESSRTTVDDNLEESRGERAHTNSKPHGFIKAMRQPQITQDSMHSALTEQVSTFEEVFVDLDLPEDDLLEARQRFLAALIKAYQKMSASGKMTSGALRLLTDAVRAQTTRCEKGWPLNSWEFISANVLNMSGMKLSKYATWWPANLLLDQYTTNKLSFVLQVAWNFVNGFNAVQVKHLLNVEDGHPLEQQLTREVNHQLQLAEKTMKRIEASVPVISRAVKTRFAAKIMLTKYTHLAEELGAKGFITEKEEEVMTHTATTLEVKLASHPSRQSIPNLNDVMQRIEFLYLLTPEERNRLYKNKLVRIERHPIGVSLTKYGYRDVHAEPGIERTKNRRMGWWFLVMGTVERIVPMDVTDSVDDQSVHSQVTSSSRRGMGKMLSGLVSNVSSHGKVGGSSGHKKKSLSRGASSSSLIKLNERETALPAVMKGGDPNHGDGLYRSGSLFGISDSLMDRPLHATYKTATFCDVVFCDKRGLLAEAESMPNLKRGLWVTVAAHTLRRCPSFSGFPLPALHRLLLDCDFYDGVGKGITIRPKCNALLLKGSVAQYIGGVPEVFCFAQELDENEVAPRTGPLFIKNTTKQNLAVEFTAFSKIYIITPDKMDEVHKSLMNEQDRLDSAVKMKYSSAGAGTFNSPLRNPSASAAVEKLAMMELSELEEPQDLEEPQETEDSDEAAFRDAISSPSPKAAPSQGF